MQLKTRKGSRVHVFKVLADGLLGAYETGDGGFIPCRWFNQGLYLKTGKQCSLDIIYGEESNTTGSPTGKETG